LADGGGGVDPRDLVRAGAGELKADLVIRGGRLVNVATAEVYPADVAVFGPTIVAVGDVSLHAGETTRVVDAGGRFLTPGLIDGHLHMECSKLSVTSLAGLLVPLGTTSVVSGLDQILVVAGLDGVRAFLDEAKATPLKIFWGAPCKTPYTIPTSTVGYRFGPDDHEVSQLWPECVGVWETVREFIQEEDEDVLAAIAIARRNRLPVLGCAPMARGPSLSGYLSAGIRYDHESYDADEALEKLRGGMHLGIRESSFAHFLDENVTTITERAPGAARRVSFCTDDICASDVLERGHLDNLIRMAVRRGVNPIVAVQMATINCAEALRIDDRVGLIAPGRAADILIVDDLDDFTVRHVISNGRLVAEEGVLIDRLEPPSRSALLTDTFHVAAVGLDDFVVRTDADSGRVRVLAMAMTEQIFVRDRRDVVLDVKGGIVQPDPDQDILYVSVVERYGKTSNRPVAFISGFGLRSGALATSTAPDDNNIVCVGASSADMAVAVRHLADHGGGQVVVDGEEVVEFLELPIGGIVADLEPAEMARREARLEAAARGLGCDLRWPFMYLFFLPITAIPDYAITDVGAIDVVRMERFEPVLGPA
jgi:adenine deaminase